MLINIIDGDGTENKRTNFHEDTKAWMDRRITKGFIKTNVSHFCDVVDYPPDPSLTIESRFDY
jgi:hypothetical protein